VKGADDQTIRDDLEALEHKIHRLRIDYDQYFMGSARREPSQLRGEVQKTITRYASEPPRNTQLKFKFNALVARFQALRALWGRTQREIEAGTYRGHRFRADIHDRERSEATDGSKGTEAGPVDAAGAGPKRPGGVDRLLDAIISAREKTGEARGAADRQHLERQVREQTRLLREKHPGSKVKFRVVIEGNRAKLKASLAS
jgi:hypothetical protein